jgi:hypothetical protein
MEKRNVNAMAFIDSRSLWPQAANHLVPGASFLFVRAEASSTPTFVLTVQKMVKRMRDQGLPISSIAEIAKVERKTVYSWLDGAEVREGNVARVDTLFRSLNACPVDYRSLHRVWNRKLHHGYSIKELLCADTLSGPAISNALSELSFVLKRHSEREESRGAVSGTTLNSVIDEMPVATIDL